MDVGSAVMGLERSSAAEREIRGREDCLRGVNGGGLMKAERRCSLHP